MPEDFNTKEDSLDSVTGHDPTMIVDVPERLGPYRLLRLLGRGGMGEVWLAHDSKLDREVAIKLMRRELMAREDAVKRFYREARAVARLNHPNIVQVYAIGEEGPIIYMVMEYVDGETVSQRLKRLGPLPLKECVNILLQAVEGLGYACARGIIHRDVKPSNLMISNEFRVKIADFGLAKMIEHDSQMTVAGTAIGSPNYMSPEQARGEEADHRSDIYALGISFYQMLTNELPFTGQTPLTVLLRQIQDPLPEPEYLRQLENGRVLEVIKKMTAKNPDDRYQTYGGLAAALAALAPDAQPRPTAHAITATVPTPPGGTKESAGTPSDATTDEGAIKTRIEPLRTPSATDQHATATIAAPPAPRERSTIMILAFAGIAVVGIVVFGTVAIMRMQSPGPAVEVAPRHVAPTTPAPTQPPTTPVVQAQSSSAPAGPTPTPTPVGFDVAAATNRPAQEQPARPTPGAAQPPVIAAAPPPRAPGLPSTQGPPPPLTPAPTTISFVILGRPDAVAGERVPLFETPEKLAVELNAGTRLPFSEVVDAGVAGKFYKVIHQGRPYLVKLNDAHPDVFGGGRPRDDSAAQKGLTVRLAIPNGRPDDTIPVYWGPTAKRELTRLPAGTELPAEEDPDGLGYYVSLPDGKKGFVLKTMAQPLK